MSKFSVDKWEKAFIDAGFEGVKNVKILSRFCQKASRWDFEEKKSRILDVDMWITFHTLWITFHTPIFLVNLGLILKDLSSILALTSYLNTPIIRGRLVLSAILATWSDFLDDLRNSCNCVRVFNGKIKTPPKVEGVSNFKFVLSTLAFVVLRCEKVKKTKALANC